MNGTQTEDNEAPKVLSRYALGARRILSDQTVQALYSELEAQFLAIAINGPSAELREQNRVNLLLIQGIFNTLQEIARNNLPDFLKAKEEQAVHTGDGSPSIN